MPSCLVNQCVSKTGRKGQNGQVILHPFPKDLSRIKVWLQQTGQIFKDLNALAQKILDENKKNKYRLCSCHFTLDSYIVNIQGRSLRVDAVPSIFPIVKEGECIIEENLKKDRVRKRKRRFDTLVPATSMNERIKAEEEMLRDSETTISTNKRIKVEEEDDDEEFFDDIELTKIGFCSIGTQTDHTLSNSIVIFKEKQVAGSDDLDGPLTPGFVHKKSEKISRIQKDQDLCDIGDEQTITVKEEPEDFSEIDLSTRYWKVESSVCGDQDLLSQVQTCNGV